MRRLPACVTQYYRAPALDGVELLTAHRYAMPFPWHAHEAFTVTLVTAGTESLQLPDQLLYAPAGSLSLTHPQEVHATPLRDATGYSFCTFYLSPALLTQLAGGQLPYFPQRVLHHPGLAAHFQQAAQQLPLAGPAGAAQLVAALQALLRHHARPAGLPAPEVPRQVTAIRHQLEERLLNPPALAQLARPYGWSVFQLLRYFRQHTGLTPQGYLLLRRIDAAKRLLAQGCPLVEAALEVGFYDQAHFARFFRRFVGVSPGAYQASVRAGGRCKIVQDPAAG